MNNIQRARALRRNQTDAEVKLWFRRRGRRLEGLKFVRQKPIGSYVVDFACPAAKLAIELDGGQHAGRLDEDEARTSHLRSEGWEVLRFWNNEVAENADGSARKLPIQSA